MSRGRAIPLAELDRLRTTIKPQITVSGDDLADMGMPFTATGANLTPVENGRGEEIFGGMQFSFGPAGSRGRGNIFHCTSTTTLLEHRLYMNPSAPANMYFVVYEGPADVGIYNLISAANLNPSATGEG